MSLLHSGSTASDSKLYVEDVFSTYLYTGNGSTQTITNGIDLAGKGGLVFKKSRNNTGAPTWNDSARGLNNGFLRSDTTSAASGSSNIITAFNSNGFDVGGSGSNAGDTYVSWTFRKAPKFFDVVTYTGNGATERFIYHNSPNVTLTPGMVIIKRVDSASDWWVKHQSVAGNLKLNSTEASGLSWWFAGPGYLYVNNNIDLNINGATYVAYLFAHDTTADGIIQCGSFTTDVSGNATVNLGWEPQWLLVKRTDSTSQWFLYDTMRGFTARATNSVQSLYPNLSNAEAGANGPVINSTGFIASGNLGSTATYIYIAIRRPNKPPTTGTQVYNAIARTGNNTVTTLTGVGFPPDMMIAGKRTGTHFVTTDRMRGGPQLMYTTLTNEEATDANEVTSYAAMDGVIVGAGGTYVNPNTVSIINWFFRRATGFFDMVCYTGTGSTYDGGGRLVSHNLTIQPEMVIVKRRDSGGSWYVGNLSAYASSVDGYGDLLLNSTNFVWNGTSGVGTRQFGSASSPLPGGFNSTSFVVNGIADTSSATFVAYLFATVAGVSKVGSYTGNGSSQTINCGFSAGARFVLIKRTDNTGDWKIIDSVRGITASSDPTLALNSTAAEVTGTDCIDPNSAGFDVVQEATNNLNVNGGQYVFLAIS